MNYTKPMIELVYEIRRQVPSELKPGVKLANPELFDELKSYYHDKAKTITKALIRELFHLADKETQLLKVAEEVPVGPKQHSAMTKMYRGVVSLQEKTPSNVQKKGNSASVSGVEAEEVKKETTPAKPKRVYRGQVIA